MAETSKDAKSLVESVLQSLQTLNGWGSVEIFVQDGKVTQITQRIIKKTSCPVESAVVNKKPIKRKSAHKLRD